MCDWFLWRIRFDKIASGLRSVCCLMSFLFAVQSAQGQTTSINAIDLDYGISGRQNDTFNFDFSGDPSWVAGAQRSMNGSVDASNQRAGRVFADFQLTAPMISAAQQALANPGSTASLTFNVLSIGQGVIGTPYTDGLDLRYLGVAASDRSANTLWNTAGIGADQSDILGVLGPAGSHTVQLTNASLLNDIAAASAGQYISFGMSNTAGVNPLRPVGNSVAETYGFLMSQTLGNYALSINVVPEPTSVAIWSLLAVCAVALLGRRRLPH
jgi:hypothetical protein